MINYLNRLQAIDKSLALMCQLREARPSLEMITVLELETSQNRAPSARLFFELMGEISHEVCIIGDSPIHAEAAEVLAEQPCRLERLSETAFAEGGRSGRPSVSDRLRRLFRPSHWPSHRPSLIDRLDSETALLFVRNADRTPAACALRDGVLARRGRVFRYFKSIHDQDLGLTAGAADQPPSEAQRSASMDPMAASEVLLVHNRSFKRLLESLGYDRYPMAVTGYPLLFPAWQERVHACSAAVRWRESRASLEVSMFIRGEIAKRPPEQQVMPHAQLERILRDTMAELDALGRSYRLRIKPHPNQDVHFVRSIVEGNPEVVITYDPPAVLAATSDLVITTYTSSALDALGFGVPCIDYYKETPGFHHIHPGGYPFEQFGVVRARSREEFHRRIGEVLAPGYRVPDVARALEHQMDLAVFGRDD